MTKKVTNKQFAVLDCIYDYMKQKGYGPTVREICAVLNLASPSTVHVHLASLEKKGMIRRDPMKSRSIILTSLAEAHYAEKNAHVAGSGVATDGAAAELELPNVICVPLVGDVAAGVPILAEENITDSFYLPTDIVSDAASFMLKVRGDSMIEAGINDGDYVVVREQKVANNGEIVVAIVEDSATVKRFYKESDHIRLQPENSSMDPILVPDCQLAGKVVAVFRRL